MAQQRNAKTRALGFSEVEVPPMPDIGGSDGKSTKAQERQDRLDKRRMATEKMLGTVQISGSDDEVQKKVEALPKGKRFIGPDGIVRTKDW
jgi:hypothetical protein